VAVAISLTWKDASPVARVILVAAGIYALLSLYAPIRLVGPVRRSTITSEHLADAGARNDGEETLGRLYTEAAAANDHETLRLSNLQAASRNDLAVATVMFAVWGVLAIAGCAR
jgi:hypothetical protein